jgi:cytochrome c
MVSEAGRSNLKRILVSLCAVVILLAPSHAHAAGNAATGAALFNRCALCHSATKGGGNKIGPNLFGVVGRKAGTYPGFSYSAAMKNSGIVWTSPKLDAYLVAPQQIVPGNSMPFAGIADAPQRANLVAYLATLK